MKNPKSTDSRGSFSQDYFISYILGVRKSYRGKKLEEQLNDYAVPFEIQWGLEPEINSAEIQQFKSVKFQQFALRRILSDNEIACTLGHRKIYERFIKSRHEWAFVLEDDSEVRVNPLRFLLELPTTPAPILINVHDSASIRMTKKNSSRILNSDVHIKSPNLQIRRLNDALSGTYGYILNRKAAEELLQLKFKNSVGIADWPYGISKKVLIFDALPPIVIPRSGSNESIIGTRIPVKGKRLHRIPRPDRVVRGLRLGIPIQIAIHQEIVLKASTLYREFKERASNIVVKRKTLLKRKWFKP